MRNIYTVGLPDSDADFDSIQDAIDQAVLDGHDGADPAIVDVGPGTYVENIVMQAGIHVFGTSRAVVDGNVLFDLDAQVDPETTICVWRQVTIAATGVGVDAVTFTGIVFQRALFIEATIGAADGDGFVVNNTGLNAGDPSLVGLFLSSVEVDGAGNAALRITDGLVFASLGQLAHIDTTEASVVATAGALFGLAMFMNVMQLTGRVVCEDAIFFGRRMLFEAAGDSALDLTTSVALLSGGTVVDCDTNPAITGDGISVIARDTLTFTNSDGTTGIVPSDFFVEAATLIHYAAGDPTDWTDPDPSTVQEAIDRLAAAVSGLLGGGIP